VPETTASTYPRGWFVVAFSSEIAKGEVKPLRYFGERLVAFRGDDGVVHVLDAYCAHMGADLGSGGKVEGNTIRCPFHAWRYCGTGECVEIPYAKKIPAKARQRSWPVCERNGVVLVWHDGDGRAPNFEIPVIAEYGTSEWLPWTQFMYSIRTHPREIVENLADKAHFPAVHATEIDAFAFEVDAHTACQRVRGRALLANGGVDNFSSTTTYHGPGYLLMRMEGALQNYMLIAHTPIDTGSLDLRMSVMLKIVGNREKTEGFVAQYMQNLKSGFEDDIRVWENKLYREVPVLCDGDGPIMQLRRWYRQFYAPASEAPADEPAAQQT
jgi:3-ketosteroid 9alpha-monooxygenase subunit A